MPDVVINLPVATTVMDALVAFISMTSNDTSSSEAIMVSILNTTKFASDNYCSQSTTRKRESLCSVVVVVCGSVS